MKNTETNHLEILNKTFNVLEETMQRWNETDFDRIEKISRLLDNKYETAFIKNIYTIVTAEYSILPERNMEELTKRVQIQFNNQLDEETATKVLLIIIFGTHEVSENDLITKQIKLSHGLDQNSNTGDEVENASGEFGYSITNPIPLQGIDKINDYFAKLKLVTGETITYHRLGSLQSENLPFPVDKYEVFNAEKELVATLFVYAYHGRNSNKVPDGFLPF